jgi:hypothetical protein
MQVWGIKKFDSRDGKIFSSRQNLGRLWGLPASFPMGARSDSFGRKWQWRGPEYSPPTSAEIKNGGATPPFSNVFMTECLNNNAQGL